jgi:hypothetical protein
MLRTAPAGVGGASLYPGYCLFSVFHARDRLPRPGRLWIQFTISALSHSGVRPFLSTDFGAWPRCAYAWKVLNAMTVPDSFSIRVMHSSALSRIRSSMAVPRRMFARLSLGPKPSSPKITSSVCELYLRRAVGFDTLTGGFSVDRSRRLENTYSVCNL